MKNKIIVSTLSVLLLTGLCLIPSFTATAKTPAVTTLTKGVNIGDWLDEDDSYYIQTTRYTKSDFEDIKSLGFDHIRLEINFETTDSPSPDFPLSPIVTGCMDNAVTWAEQVGLKVVLVNNFDDIIDGSFNVTQTWLDVVRN